MKSDAKMLRAALQVVTTEAWVLPAAAEAWCADGVGA